MKEEGPGRKLRLGFTSCLVKGKTLPSALIQQTWLYCITPMGMIFIFWQALSKGFCPTPGIHRLAVRRIIIMLITA